MSERRYHVSFTTEPLTDRDIDNLADGLHELGADEICFRPVGAEWKVCVDCGGRYLQWGSHAERCSGVRA